MSRIASSRRLAAMLPGRGRQGAVSRHQRLRQRRAHAPDLRFLRLRRPYVRRHLPGQRFQEGHQVRPLPRGQKVQRVDLFVPPRARCTAAHVELHHVGQRLQAAVMHVRRRQRDVAQRGRFERAAVRVHLGHRVPPQIGQLASAVDAYPQVVELVVREQRELLVDGVARRAVALVRLAENLQAPDGRRTHGLLVAAEIIFVEGGIPADHRPLERGDAFLYFFVRDRTRPPRLLEFRCVAGVRAEFLLHVGQRVRHLHRVLHRALRLLLQAGRPSVPELHGEIRRVEHRGGVACPRLSVYPVGDGFAGRKPGARTVARGARNRVVHRQLRVVVEPAAERDRLRRGRIVRRSRYRRQPQGRLDLHRRPDRPGRRSGRFLLLLRSRARTQQDSCRQDDERCFSRSRFHETSFSAWFESTLYVLARRTPRPRLCYKNIMRIFRPGLVLALTFFAFTAAAVDEPAPLRGYSAAAARAERDWETRFRAIPDTRNLHDYMQRLSARPHHVGSAYDKDNAEWILARFRSWGLDAKIESFDVLFPTPRERAVELLRPARFVARLQEPAVAVDPTSSQQTEQLPTYNAYSRDGDVTGRLVYVNYGVPEDYEQLDRLGISVKGAIVIARYGASWRGIKPKVAAEHGAIGCLIYSDPKEDGYSQGEVFPKGPYRPPDGVQRGSVMDMPVYPGDPLTPGVGATPGATRLKLEEAKTITRIPVLPISYADAQPLLAALSGPVAPAPWRGALPITYHVGPGPAEVHLKVKSNWDIRRLYNVIFTIPGSTYPDEWIIRGNHHDAWVNGADDPVSGANVLMEEARGLAELLKQGWKPKRTIVYCVWDGEEEGLLGSTEWAEEHAEDLRRHAAVYINSDANSRGFLSMSGSHTLEKFMNVLFHDTATPEKNISVWKRLQAHEIAEASNKRPELRTRADLRIDALGSGSDYTAFLDHLGIASLNLGFGGEDGSGIYHSIYDDFSWYTRFSDTDFSYGRALAQTAGTAVLRLADADLLPYDFTDFTDTIRRYVDEVEKLARDETDRILERNRQLDEGVPRAARDPKRRAAPPERKDPAPEPLNFAPLRNGLAALERSAELYDRALAKASENGGAALARASLRDANTRLIAVERSLTLRGGLPNRPWFENQIYAPGFYTGYGVKTLPGVRESIEQKDWKLAQQQIARVGRVLENAGEAIQSAAAILSRDR